jgi:hypothetical protein
MTDTIGEALEAAIASKYADILWAALRELAKK